MLCATGPVFVEFPIDTLYPYALVAAEVGFSGGKGLLQRLIAWYLDNHLSNVFASAWDPQPVAPLPVDIPFAPQAESKRGSMLIVYLSFLVNADLSIYSSVLSLFRL